MNIEAGKSYRMRDGRTVGPVEPWDKRDPSKGYHATEKVDGYFAMWTNSGACEFFVSDDYNAQHSQYDLMEEVVTEHGMSPLSGA